MTPHRFWQAFVLKYRVPARPSIDGQPHWCVPAYTTHAAPHACRPSTSWCFVLLAAPVAMALQLVALSAPKIRAACCRWLGRAGTPRCRTRSVRWASCARTPQSGASTPRWWASRDPPPAGTSQACLAVTNSCPFQCRWFQAASQRTPTHPPRPPGARPGRPHIECVANARLQARGRGG